MMYDKDAKGRETPSLEDYLTAIQQRKWLILLCGALALALAIIFTSSRTETFTATSRVLVNPTAVGSTDGRLVSPVLERQRVVIDSNATAERAADALGLGQSGRALLRDLDVFFVDDSDSLDIQYVNTDPEVAQAVVNAFAEEYVASRVEQADDLDANTINALQEQIDEIDVQIDELERQIATASAERSQVIAAEGDSSALTDQITSLRTSLSSLITERRMPASDLADTELSQRTRIAPAEVLQLASLPTEPNGFSDRILQAIGLFLGLGAGVGLAFVLHRLDRTARESSDVELALGTSVLASVPPFGLGNRSGASAVVMLASGRSARIQRARESFRRLRSSVQFLAASREADTYLVTSARPGEGKSTVSVNLAVAMAQGGGSVCLVNADLRRPTVEKMLGVPNSQGLSDWLVDNTITDILVPISNIPGLVVLPSGPPPTNPGELLSSGELSSLMDELITQFDTVIIDAPPILSAADASTIAPSVDGTLIVVDGQRTDTDTLLRVRGELERTGGTVLGAVLNRDSSDNAPRLGRDRYAYERVSASRSSQ